MSKSDVFENDLLLHIFNNVAIANIGDVAGLPASVAAGQLWYSLHTADPGEIGTAITSETAYTGYARQGRARSGANFVVTGNSVSPAADVDFPAATAAPGTPLTHFGIVNSASGAGKLLYSGTLTPNITMAVSTIPRILATSTITED